MRNCVVWGFVFLSSVICTIAAAQSAPPRKDIPAIAKAANGAIVSIVMSDKAGKPITQGSGFVVSKDGVIVTNYHVISEGSSAVVKLPDGAFYAVDGVVASDKARDLAVIKAHGQSFRTLTLANSDAVQVGEEVVAIGNPLSLESTVSNGIVSAIRTADKLGGKFLQITAPISPGSSGGPLFNMAGEVVGITTMYLKSGENLNFAIPVNEAKHMLLAKSSQMSGLPNEPGSKEIQPKKANTKATLFEQRMCSEQANKVLRKHQLEEKDHPTRFREDGQYAQWQSTSVSLWGLNHYDASTGICYVQIYRGVDTTLYFLDHRDVPNILEVDIYDAFEGTDLGRFFQLLPRGQTPSAPSSCEVHPPGRPEIDCTSEAEFHRLALKYFGISK